MRQSSNENCNGLIRYFIPKGTDINSIPPSQTTYINKAINNKKRRILGYRSSEQLFLQEISALDCTESMIFFLNWLITLISTFYLQFENYIQIILLTTDVAFFESSDNLSINKPITYTDSNFSV